MCVFLNQSVNGRRYIKNTDNKQNIPCNISTILCKKKCSYNAAHNLTFYRFEASMNSVTNWGSLTCFFSLSVIKGPKMFVTIVSHLVFPHLYYGKLYDRLRYFAAAFRYLLSMNVEIFVFLLYYRLEHKGKPSQGYCMLEWINKNIKVKKRKIPICTSKNICRAGQKMFISSKSVTINLENYYLKSVRNMQNESLFRQGRFR